MMYSVFCICVYLSSHVAVTVRPMSC